VEYEIPALHLAPGTYFVTCSVRYLAWPWSREDVLHYLEKVAHFSVRHPDRNAAFRSVYDPPVIFHEESVAAASPLRSAG